MGFLYNIDYKILDFIHNIFKCDFLDNVVPYITRLGDLGIVWIIIGVILLFFKKTRRMGITVLLALILGLLVGNVLLKNLIARARPYTFDNALVNDTQLLIGIPKDFSFPSGHSLSSFGASTAIFFYHKKAGICAYILASIIAFTRLYLYVHYPSDILAGILLGILMGICAYYIANKYIKKPLNNQ